MFIIYSILNYVIFFRVNGVLNYIDGVFLLFSCIYRYIMIAHAQKLLKEGFHIFKHRKRVLLRLVLAKTIAMPQLNLSIISLRIHIPFSYILCLTTCSPFFYHYKIIFEML